MTHAQGISLLQWTGWVLIVGLCLRVRAFMGTHGTASRDE